MPLIPRKIYNVINVKVEFGEGEDKVLLDNIPKRAVATSRKSELPTR